MDIILKNEGGRKNRHPHIKRVACEVDLPITSLHYFDPEQELSSKQKKFRKKVLLMLQKTEITTLGKLLATDAEELGRIISCPRIKTAVVNLQRKLIILKHQRTVSSNFYEQQRKSGLPYDVRMVVCVVHTFKPVISKIKDLLFQLLTDLLKLLRPDNREKHIAVAYNFLK